MPSLLDDQIRREPESLVGAWDCHVHVFGAEGKYPLAGDRRYTPELADVAALTAHLLSVGVDRVVLIQPTTYGQDNQCLLDALETLGKMSRAVMVLDPRDLDDPTLLQHHARGVRGIRINPPHRVRTLLEAEQILLAALPRLSGTGWQIEVNCVPELARPIANMCADADVRLVFDHLAGLDPSDPGFEGQIRQTLAMAKETPAWIKLSGPDRVCRTDDDRSRWAEAAAALAELMPDRLVWGSDWPHTPLETKVGEETRFRLVDDGVQLAWLSEVLGERDFRRVLVDNPSRLFD